MTDYWSRLKLNQAWSSRERFNFLMEKIETAIVGDSDLVETLNSIIDEMEDINIPSKISDLDNDTGFIDDSVLEDYITKSETIGLVKNDGSIDPSIYLTEHQDISGKIDRTELFKNGVFTTKSTKSNGSVAQLWNESDGGGALFTDATTNIVSFVGVNEGSVGSDVYAQIYSKNKSNNTGTRININPTGAYYTVGSSTSFDSDDEIITRKDLDDLISRIEELESKLE